MLAQDIPLTRDLVKLTGVITKAVADLTEEVRFEPNTTNWRKLASALLARLITFNKRRGGEMSRMLVETYEEVVKNPEKYKLQEEIFGSLSQLEKNLSRTMLLVNIMGELP